MDVDGEKFMSPENLIRDYLGMQKVDEYNEVTLKLLAGVVDQTKDRYGALHGYSMISML